MKRPGFLSLLFSLFLLAAPLAVSAQGFSGVKGVRGVQGMKGVSGADVTTGDISRDRVLPRDIDAVAELGEVRYPHLVLVYEGSLWAKILTLGLGGDKHVTLETASGVRIRNAENRFITRGRLGEHIGETVALRLDRQSNKVVDIWILNPDERARLADRVDHWR